MPKSYHPEGQPRRTTKENSSQVDTLKMESVKMNLGYGKVESLILFCAAEASFAGIWQRVKLYRRRKGI